MEYSKQYVKKPEVLCAFRVGYDEPYEKGFFEKFESNSCYLERSLIFENEALTYSLIFNTRDISIEFRNVKIGDWIVKDYLFGFKIYSNNEFKQKFDII